MKLVLLRHATRSAQGLGDTPLNQIGLTQADHLVQMLAPQGPFPVATHVISSPKKRARQTIAPLAESLSLKVLIDPRLDERKNSETMLEFESRVREVLEHLSGGPHPLQDIGPGSEVCAVLCSHMDWLEAALNVLPHDMSEIELAMGFTTAEFKIFKFQAGMWTYKGGGVSK